MHFAKNLVESANEKRGQDNAKDTLIRVGNSLPKLRRVFVGSNSASLHVPEIVLARTGDHACDCFACLRCSGTAIGQNAGRAPVHDVCAESRGTTFIRAGPFSGTLGLGVGYLYTDDANTSNVDKLSLNQVFENLNVDLVWPLSPFNPIDLRAGGQVQENFYSNGSNALNLAITPGSQIQLQARVGDFLLSAFERVTIIQAQ